MTQQSSGGNQIARNDIGGHRAKAAAMDDKLAMLLNEQHAPSHGGTSAGSQAISKNISNANL